MISGGTNKTRSHERFNAYRSNKLINLHSAETTKLGCAVVQTTKLGCKPKRSALELVACGGTQR
jgi:hypothetical protein